MSATLNGLWWGSTHRMLIRRQPAVPLGCLMDDLVSSLVMLVRMESHIHGNPDVPGLPAAEHVQGPDLAPDMVR